MLESDWAKFDFVLEAENQELRQLISEEICKIVEVSPRHHISGNELFRVLSDNSYLIILTIGIFIGRNGTVNIEEDGSLVIKIKNIKQMAQFIGLKKCDYKKEIESKSDDGVS